MNAVYLGDHRVLVAPVWGGALVVPSYDLSSCSLIVNGAHEVPLTKYLIENVKPGQIVLDIGANIGYFTALLGCLVGPSGHVVAYEPNPRVYPFLMENLSLYNIKDRVTVLQKAAHAAAGRIKLYVADRFLGNTSIHQHDADYFSKFYDTVSEIEADAEPLDANLERFAQIDLVKLDIEGGEYHALLGMRELLAREAVGTIVMEINPLMLQQDLPALRELLSDIQEKYNTVFYTLSQEGQPEETDLPPVFQGELVPSLVIKPGVHV